jgi:hypothetical protein
MFFLQSMRSLVLAIVLALGSIPTAVWAKTASPSSAEISRTRPATRLATAADSPTAQRQAYAARETTAATQEKFEGGDSTIWIGGSTVVIVLLVVLIVVLL